MQNGIVALRVLTNSKAKPWGLLFNQFVRRAPDTPLESQYRDLEEINSYGSKHHHESTSASIDRREIEGYVRMVLSLRR